MRRIPIALLALSLALSIPGPAGAVPRVGSDVPDVVLRDGWDRDTHLARFRGMPLLVIYEDKGSTEQNDPLKRELARLAKGGQDRKKIALVAIADVSDYDFWPARGFVKDAIRSESHKQDTLIYCDWDGHVRRTLSLAAGASNVVFYGRDGKALFSRSGPLSPEARRELLDLLRAHVETSGTAAR